jgi:microcystin-dependent protein/roadblock/LC7 domain-containing protein
MAYEINYTDSVNKGTIVIEDGTINQDTSLKLPGRNFTGYGAAISENFLHLLENFANSNSPDSPVEGQLWYDNTDGVDQLKIYDGTQWVTAGGLKKAASAPEVANSNPGDLWANTDTQQLYLFTGSNWILIGPEFSDGLLTGTAAENILGDDDVAYNILTVKIEDKIAAIFSAQAFVPKTTIPGFRTGINAGLNLSNEALVGSQLLKYYGTAEKAENLIIAGETVAASNFLRGNASSTTNFDLKVKSNEGIQVGSGGQLSVFISGNAGVVQHNTSGSNIDFRLRNGDLIPTVMRLDSAGNVGINTGAPEEKLEVSGNIKINPEAGVPDSGYLQIESTVQASNFSTGSIRTKGGLGVARDAFIGGNLTIEGATTTANITPDFNSSRNIGTTNNKFDQVYANTFVGNVQGNVSGTVSGRAGSADKLASATTFAATGDVNNVSFEFDGQTGGSTKTFNLRIANSFISNKDVIYDAGNADEILLNKTTGTTGVYRITKRNFLKTIPLVPPGVMVPFGGEEAPDGWLFCDGSEVKISDYTTLFNVIRYNFKDASLLSDSGVNTFALPDMRGRFPLGLDNLGGPSANRVTDIAADAIGGNAGGEKTTIDINNLPEHEHDMEGDSGTQYYAMRVGSGSVLDDEAVPLTIEPGAGGTQGFASSGGVKTTETLGEPVNVMNPYLAVNYIIYTGE